MINVLSSVFIGLFVLAGFVLSRFKVPSYVAAMFVATGIYLTIEIPFTIHLIEVVGGLTTQSDIDGIEKFGRLLTGIAVALAFVGMVSLPMRHAIGIPLRSSIPAVISTMFLIVTAVYFALHFYGEGRGLISGADARKEAFLANLAKRSIVEDGVKGAIPASSDPMWLAFVSSAPVLFDAHDLISMSGTTVKALAEREAKRSLGTVDEARDAFVAQSKETFDSAYGSYLDANRKYNSFVADADNVADDKWRDYARRMNSQFGNRRPARGTQAYAMTLREIRKAGVPVDGSFELSDEWTFKTLVRRSVKVEAMAGFRKGVADTIGKGSNVVPDMDVDKFLVDPGVQRSIRQSMSQFSIPAGIVVTPEITTADFERGIYPQMIAATARGFAEIAGKDGPSLTMPSYRDTGKSAVMAAQLPATALLLSLAGAIFHIYKFSGYGMVIIGSLFRSRFLSSPGMKHVFASAMMITAIWAMRTDLPTPVDMVGVKTEGGIYATLVKQAVTMQPGIFALGGELKKIGPWGYIEPLLPRPRLVASAPSALANAVSLETTASVVAETPVPTEKPIEIAAEISGNIPVPTPAPR
jgi:hypothetical protein